MGFLDNCGTFLTAMGAVYTPGMYQPLLNQTLIPLTMLFTFLLLKARFHKYQIFGALLIVGGAITTVSPSLVAPNPSAQFKWYACLLYWSSNVPMACSLVYKELAFNDGKVIFSTKPII